MSNSITNTAIITPEDLQKLDIKKEPEKELSGRERSNKKKAVIGLIAISLFLVGMFIAPPPITEGKYQIELNYGDYNEVIDIEVSENLKDNKFIQLNTNGGLIEYYMIYSIEPGTVISITFTPSKIIKNIQAPLLAANIRSETVDFDFYGRESVDKSIEYNFRILTDTRIALGLMFLISFLWITEVIPLAASSLLIPVILVISEVQNATLALQPFSQPIIFLFLAGFLMAEAMSRTGLDKFISYRIFSIIPPNGKILLFALMTLSAVFSMFMSNTAAVALLIPLALQLLKGVEVEDLQYKKTVILGIAYAATIGGIGSIIGSPPNIISVQLLQEFNPEFQISFLEWFLFGLPVVFIMLPLTFTILWVRFRPKIEEEKLKQAQIQTKIIIKEELQLTKEQLIVLIIFSITLCLWLTTSIHGISASIIALQAAVALFIVGQLIEKDLNAINWNALLTFGGGLALGGLIIQTGLADYMGSLAIRLAGLPLIITLFIISLAGLILTGFASNTASAVIMIPIVLPLGYILGISPIVLAIMVAIAASIDFAIVIGTPPTMMAYSTGLFEVKEIFQIGIVIDIIGLIVITVISTFLFVYFAGFV